MTYFVLLVSVVFVMPCSAPCLFACCMLFDYSFVFVVLCFVCFYLRCFCCCVPVCWFSSLVWLFGCAAGVLCVVVLFVCFCVVVALLFCLCGVLCCVVVWVALLLMLSVVLCCLCLLRAA